MFITEQESPSYEINFYDITDKKGEEFVDCVEKECSYLIDAISHFNLSWLSNLQKSIFKELDINQNKIKKHIHNIR